MKKIFVFLIWFLLLPESILAIPSIDNTCSTCDRRYLDSMNVFNRRPIRVNQVGYKADATHNKHAFAADYPAGTKFKVINANTGAEAYSGSLDLITPSAPKPGMYVNGAFNSISQVYKFGSNTDSVATSTEALYRADFTSLTTPGKYFVVIGTDTSASFLIDANIYNSIFETALKFFGIQRCGNTNSQIHGPCHLKDGSAVGHDLTGGWHDCGDHFKVSETVGYAAYVLSTTYLVYEEKAEDRYGKSYDDTVFTDGIPDVLYEAKIGVDYIFKLYKASKADGLIAQADMYHSVGVSDGDHAYWDVPEKQDAQDFSKGGPDRPVAKQIGANVSGIFAAALANVGYAWQVYDANYADSLIEAAKDIYQNVVKPNFKLQKNTTDNNNYYNNYYTGQGRLDDDAAAAALSLWYATKDTTYAYDLYKNPEFGDGTANYENNLYQFQGGFMASHSSLLFTQGGWATDYQNIHAHVLFFFSKLILPTVAKAQEYNISSKERDDLLMRNINTFYRMLDDATSGDSVVQTNQYGQITTEKPYGLVWTSFDWGVNRYNLGVANAFFMLYEITGEKILLNVSLDNIYYSMGANPWDISFLMGAGEKNLNHPHNRSSNPDGYNAGGMPYEYKCPKGALMGGRAPHLTLLDDWEKYTATETCIDFSAQLLMPAQSLAEPLPIDLEGPLFSNVMGTPISDTSAMISWDANEVALVTVFYSTTNDGLNVKSVQQNTASKGGSLEITGLTPGTTYYFYLEGMDTKRNISKDDNHGYWYSFTMTSQNILLTDITICQVDNRSAKIYWWSSSRANTTVRYGTSETALTETYNGSSGAVLFHEAELTNLTAGTTYYFKVSSGTSESQVKQFTTEAQATYADFSVYMKPTSNQEPCSAWEDCSKFFVTVANNDTIDYEDIEMRIYFSNPNLSVQGGNQKHCWDAKTNEQPGCNITFGTATLDGTGNGWYLPVYIKSPLKVSGQVIFDFSFKDANWNKTISYKDLANSWSLIPHTASTDPEYFKGIDLTKGPYYTESETEWLEKDANGVTERAYVKNPYITLHYHGTYLYGYAPDYTPDAGPQQKRTVSLNFTNPFVAPAYSKEMIEDTTTFVGTSTVSPTGFLDYFEANNQEVTSRFYDPADRFDSFIFAEKRNLNYGNNYIEWVSWHNHNANSKGSYDCACAVVRSNVEVDSITVPVEQRYLVFTKDTITAYTGKMVEVKVELYDENLSLLNTEFMTLTPSTGNNVGQFYLNATATIPVNSIPLENGVATFYVKANEATSTTLRVTAPNTVTSTVQYTYVPASAVLIIEDLPPWPIIDVAKMIDSDCDNKGDIIEITLSNEYQPGQSFNKLIYTYNQDTLETTVATTNGKILSASIQLPDSTMNTNPNGVLTLISSIDGGLKEHSDFYTDGISPTLLSISVLERLPNATSDQVFMQFSEPISAPGTDWPIQLYSSTGNLLTSIPTVNSSKIYNDSLNIWSFDVAIPSDGVSLVQENMQGQLLTGASIVDKAGNGVSTCAQPKLPITLKIIPVPLTYASISDANEDGLAEHVRVVFERGVDAKHQPDEISVIFGTSPAETLWTKNYTFITDSIATLNLSQPFSLGKTSGTYNGSNQGRSLIGAGQVIQHKGNGANYESNSILAEDLAGPVFISASLKENVLYNLTAIASEPIMIKDSALELLQRERSGPIGLNHTEVASWSLSQNTTTLNLVYTDDISVLIKEGDRIRFSPLDKSMFSDKSGNLPALNNPWVGVMGDGNPKIKYSIHLRENIPTIKKDVTPSSDPSPSKFCLMNPVTQKLDCMKDGLIVETIDTTNSPLQGVVWEIKLEVPRGTSYNEAPAWDTLRLEYDIPIYSNLGHFVQRFHEKLSIPSSIYLSSTNTISLFVEWAPRNNYGLASADGRAVGTGAYITKVDLKTKFIPNKNQDEELITRFSGKSSYNKTLRFGIRRKN